MATRTQKSSSKGNAAAPEIPLAEWIASGIGLLLVAATVVYLAYAAFAQKDSPPDILVKVVSVVPVRQGYLAQFRATNRGEQAANDVHIVGVHTLGSEREEMDAVIDFLPAQSEKQGGLFFIRNPTEGTLSVRASGYQEP